jgi:light-regulated signal transduction histidine kinase (bacteriophytochrome)
VNIQTPLPDVADVAACDREPIHIPGSIQPHGVLLAVAGRDMAVAHASANLAEVLGVDAEAAVGSDLAKTLPRLAQVVAEQAFEGPDQDEDRGAGFLKHVTFDTLAGPRSFDLATHRSAGLLVVELEEAAAGNRGSSDDLHPRLRTFVGELQTASTPEALCALAASEVRRVTGFDRVLVYRFDPDWNGTVVAEDRNGVLPSYLDLRFPASDIPAQARELYRRNRLRIIPDAAYAPVPILPTLSVRTGQPLDLSDSVLRSVSPVHVEYMRNMGTMASMSVSILVEGRFWGLITCHNKDPRRVSLPVRNACDFLTQVFALQLAARERAADAEHRLRLGAVQSRLLGYTAEEERFLDGLLKHPDELLQLGQAGGAAVVSGEHRWLIGDTPTEAEVERLAVWLGEHHREDVFATDSLAASFPEAERYSASASGLLAISISKVHASYVLWFRPEVVQTVRWGGDPTKPVLPAGPGPGQGHPPTRLHPRKSFEAWKETVRGRSLPWMAAETEAAKELRNALVGIVLRRAEELASLNEELQRSNKELEAFSYSVSHDLRAPFRHIVGYAELLRTKKAASLDEQANRYIETIIASAISAGTLVDNLLSFSQMGRATLNLLKVDMNILVHEVRLSLAGECGERRITWRVNELGFVRADPVMLRLVVENLLSNAIKYTGRREEAVIEVGHRSGESEDVYFVRDNGTGFDMAYLDKLFGVFQRLHRVEDFPGTGIGLANVRRIMERHGGRSWAEGEVDKGATFFFAFPRSTGVKPGA